MREDKRRDDALVRDWMADRRPLRLPMLRVTHVSHEKRLAGGPAGYTYRLEKAFAEVSDPAFQVNFFVLKRREQTKWFRFKASLRDYYQRARVRCRLQSRYELHLKGRLALTKTVETSDPRIWDSDLVILHNPILAENILRHRRPGPIVAMISHSPTPMFAELGGDENPQYLLDDCLRHRYLASLASRELRSYQSFDFILAPCREAHEAYFACGPDWVKAFGEDKLRYCLTGTQPPEVIQSADSWRKSLGVSADQLLAVYVGRNHPHKGTDLLFEALHRLDPETRKRVVVAFAGFKEQGPELPNARYIGYTNDVGGLVSASDFVINANRYTYFDLLTLEVLSLSKPLLATQTGGNVVLAQLAPGVKLVLPTTEDLVKGIQFFAQLNSAGRKEMGEANYSAWQKHFSPAVFAKQHLSVYDNIFKEAKSRNQ